MKRLDVQFQVDGGISLRAWLYVPQAGMTRRPAISMAHDFAAIRNMGLERFAKAFVDCGFVVLVHDHRGFGASEGQPRGDVEPWQQISDWRRAISYLEMSEHVDAERIGLWGTGYAGGHALVLGATDRRLGAVVSQVPVVSGAEQARRLPPEKMQLRLNERLMDDDRAQLRGDPPQRLMVVSSDPDALATHRSKNALDFYRQPIPEGRWQNDVTLRSARNVAMYEPGVWAARVAPTPLLMIVATLDTVASADLALETFDTAREPKSLVTMACDHFDPFQSQFEQAVGPAIEWFSSHLLQREVAERRL